MKTVCCFFKFIGDCWVLRRLMKKYDSPNIRSLFWYGLPLKFVVSFSGILHILSWLLFKRKTDETAKNYGLGTLYFEEPQNRGLDQTWPSVWHCVGLPTQPWFDEKDELAKTLEENAQVIIDEFEKAKASVGTHPDNRTVVKGGKWKGMLLYGVNGEKNVELCELLPKTTAIVEKFPLCKNYGFVEFSEVIPGTHILPHTGSSNLRLRHHLGIYVPEDTVKIRVGSEARPWIQSKCIVFDDAYEHEVVHEGEKTRVVFIVDLWHPSLTKNDIKFLAHPVLSTFGKIL